MRYLMKIMVYSWGFHGISMRYLINYGIFMGISWDIIHEHLIGYVIIDVGHFCGTMIKGVMFEIEHEKHGLWSCS